MANFSNSRTAPSDYVTIRQSDRARADMRLFYRTGFESGFHLFACALQTSTRHRGTQPKITATTRSRCGRAPIIANRTSKPALPTRSEGKLAFQAAQSVPSVTTNSNPDWTVRATFAFCVTTCPRQAACGRTSTRMLLRNPCHMLCCWPRRAFESCLLASWTKQKGRDRFISL